MPDKNTVFDFINRLKNKNDDNNWLEINRLYQENNAAATVALTLLHLMNNHNINKEEAWRVWEFKENFAITELEDAWRIFKEGGIIERNQASQNMQYQCFEAYLTQLAEKDWNEENLENMRRQTVNLINRMKRFTDENPNELCTALVVGHVQSGKTANYCADINFWIDLHRSGQIPGYDTFIILTSNNTALGTQTENRLRKDIIPVRDWCKNQKEKELKEHGGLLPFRKNDFLRSPEASDSIKQAITADMLSYTPKDNVAKCLVAVVIKNSQNVGWLNGIIKNIQTSPKGIMIIDDEADVITPTLKKNGDAAATRKKILEITKGKNCPVAYVAFTATPYATVLNQHPSKDKNPLYPHIAQVLMPSKEYFGSDRILGAYYENPSKQVVRIRDFNDDFPESMKDAFAWFICSAAARRVKNNSEKPQATSMLIHLSKRVLDHKSIQSKLEKYLRNDDADIKERCRKHWCGEDGLRRRYTCNDLPMDYPGRENTETFDIEWEDLKEKIDELISPDLITEEVNNFSKGINFRIVNASSRTGKFDFHYPTSDEANYDTAFVAIGGDRIARGLTLEGLTTTYFGRETQYGDTLLQYARWHGYRKGYEVLPRIWMTQESIKSFKYAVAMEKVSRQAWSLEFEQDHWEHPLTVACPVYSDIKPSGKMAEAINSMRRGTHFQFDTNTFPTNTSVWKEVREVTEDFLRNKMQVRYEELRGNRLWKNVPAQTVIEYLQKVAQKYPDSATFCSWLQEDSNRILERGICWNVCFIPLHERSGKPIFDKNGSYFTNQALRTVELKNKTDSYFYVKTIRSVISDDVADVDYHGNAPVNNEAVDKILTDGNCFETPLLRIYLHAPVSKNGTPWFENMGEDEIKSNPVVLLSVRRKLPNDEMLFLQVNPADFDPSNDDAEDRKERIRNTIFELSDENENSREVWCNFTPSDNSQRNTPRIATLLEGSRISEEARRNLNIDSSSVNADGHLTKDVKINGVLAYKLAKILLNDSRTYTQKDCELWVSSSDDLDLYELLQN